MGATLRSGSSVLLTLVGFAGLLGGAGLGISALMVDADASIQVFVDVLALGGLVIAVGGGVLMALGALLGHQGKASAPQPSPLSPEQRQLRDSQDFLAARSEEE